MQPVLLALLFSSFIGRPGRAGGGWFFREGTKLYLWKGKRLPLGLSRVQWEKGGWCEHGNMEVVRFKSMGVLFGLSKNDPSIGVESGWNSAPSQPGQGQLGAESPSVPSGSGRGGGRAAHA